MKDQYRPAEKIAMPIPRFSAGKISVTTPAALVRGEAPNDPVEPCKLIEFLTSQKKI
jgi:hypothetical protein